MSSALTQSFDCDDDEGGDNNEEGDDGGVHSVPSVSPCLCPACALSRQGPRLTIKIVNLDLAV